MARLTFVLLPSKRAFQVEPTMPPKVVALSAVTMKEPDTSRVAFQASEPPDA